MLTGRCRNRAPRQPRLALRAKGSCLKDHIEAPASDDLRQRRSISRRRLLRRGEAGVRGGRSIALGARPEQASQALERETLAFAQQPQAGRHRVRCGRRSCAATEGERGRSLTGRYRRTCTSLAGSLVLSRDPRSGVRRRVRSSNEAQGPTPRDEAEAGRSANQERVLQGTALDAGEARRRGRARVPPQAAMTDPRPRG